MNLRRLCLLALPICLCCSSSRAQEPTTKIRDQIGIFVEYNSTLEVSGGGVFWNGLYGAYVLGHSVLILDNADSQFNTAHGVVVESDSALFARNGATVTHNWATDGQQVECRDEESSLADDGSAIIIPPSITCTGF